MDPRQRVAVYVFRRTDSGMHVLVFDHLDFPEAGTQVPAGGLDSGEDLAGAALREVREETGLDELHLIGEVAVQERPHPHTGEYRRTTFLAAVTDWPNTEWEHSVTGDGEDATLRFRCFFLPVEMASSLLTDHQGEFLTQATRLLE